MTQKPSLWARIRIAKVNMKSKWNFFFFNLSFTRGLKPTSNQFLMDKIKSRPTFVLFEKPFHSQYGKGYGNFRFMQTLCKDII